MCTSLDPKNWYTLFLADISSLVLAAEAAITSFEIYKRKLPALHHYFPP